MAAYAVVCMSGVTLRHSLLCSLQSCSIFCMSEQKFLSAETCCFPYNRQLLWTWQVASKCLWKALIDEVMVLQARAEQETERANAAEAQVASLNQEAQAKDVEIRNKQGQVEQAQRDLSGAQVGHFVYVNQMLS